MNVSKEKFISTVKEKSVFALYKEMTCDSITPVGLFSMLNSPYSFILESVESASQHFGRFSLIGMCPRFSLKATGKNSVINDFNTNKTVTVQADPLGELKKIVKSYEPINFNDIEGFSGGAVGYLGYDTIANIEQIDMSNKDILEVPDIYFIIPKVVIVFDHFRHTVKIVFNAFIDDPQDAANIYDIGLDEINSILDYFKKPIKLPLFTTAQTESNPDFKSNFTKDEFEKSVIKAREYIKKGDAIQVVLSQRFEMPYRNHPLNLYRSLRSINPSPYMFMINFPGFSLIGSSPELMVREQKGSVTIRPIAGTRPRGKDEEEDKVLEQDLLSDKKEIAEHIMLVDLARNDIGRVCSEGSIRADQLMIIERFSHVMHITSNVIGKLSDDKDVFDLIRATFPAGTVSGAPKVRAMEIIEELENEKRGPYAGAVGYFDFNGNFDSGIIIRTMIYKNNKVYVQAGAGIVFDSIPENEYKETINKAKALFRAIQTAELMNDNS